MNKIAILSLLIPTLLFAISDVSLMITSLIGCIIILMFLSVAFFYRIRALNKVKINLLQKNEMNNKICFLQSRNASIGELTADISHQWKQPLNAISSIQCALKASIALGYEIPKDELQTSIDSSVELLAHLGDTIDTFQRFLSQHKSNHDEFNIPEQFEMIRKLTDYPFKNSKIDLRFLYDTSISIKGDANEFLHALLNIILNAKEALDNSSVSFPYIEVLLYETNDAVIITISDNAGGIDEDIIDTIFDRYITSKISGSGLGLYMAREIIVNRFAGTVAVHNTIYGACFTVILPFNGVNNSVSIQHNAEEQIQRLTERILELEEAKEHLTKWSEIFHNSHWGIAIHIGTSSKFEITNSAFNAIYGYSPDDIKHLYVRDLFCEESFSVLSEESSRAFETGHATFEALHRRKDGSIFPVFIELIVIKNDVGDILYHIANIWDKTEEYKKIDHIRMLGTALDLTNEAVYLIDTDAQFLYVNDGACRMLGYSYEEFLTMNIMDIDPYYTLEKYKIKVNSLKIYDREFTSEANVIETIHIAKNGKRIFIEVSSRFFYIGGVLYNVTTVRDITERKQTQEQLKNSEEKYRTLVENSNDNIIRYDQNRRIIFLNRTLEKTLLVSMDDVIGKRPTEIWHNAYDEFEGILEQVIATGINRDYNHKFIGNDGTLKLHHIQFIAEYDNDNNIVGALVIGRDVSSLANMKDLSLIF
jgi:PAS domain S-box-containing protein